MPDDTHNSNTIQITVNAGARRVPAGSTVNDLLASMHLSPQRVAVEVNRRLRRAGDYDKPLEEGDAIEIVTFVGGG